MRWRPGKAWPAGGTAQRWVRRPICPCGQGCHREKEQVCSDDPRGQNWDCWEKGGEIDLNTKSMHTSRTVQSQDERSPSLVVTIRDICIRVTELHTWEACVS